MPVLFFRVGYMERYDAPGVINYGGEHVVDQGEGGEMWNFREEDGRCYGFVSTHSAGLDLSRLDDTKSWNSNDELDEVDIVFFAKRPPHGQVIVGWYRDATVFHKNVRKRHNSVQGQDQPKRLHYLCEVDSENAILLPENERTYHVPHGRGFPGTRNVWYADPQNDEVAEFLDGVQDYINQWQPPNPPTNNNGNRGRHNFPDKEFITRIEQAAINITCAHYENMKRPYELKTVEKDNRGWDLEAKRNREKLYLEVKGHIGNVIQFELTPNEYTKMKKHSKIYRVCVVRNTLTAPNLVIFTPKMKNDGWFLVSEKGNEIVKLSEKIAARASEVEDYD